MAKWCRSHVGFENVSFEFAEVAIQVEFGCGGEVDAVTAVFYDSGPVI